MVFVVGLSGLALSCARLQPEELVGTYRVEYSHGVERLEIRANGTYQQQYGASDTHLTPINEGRWSFRAGGLLDADQLMLHGAVLVDRDDNRDLAGN